MIDSTSDQQRLGRRALIGGGAALAAGAAIAPVFGGQVRAEQPDGAPIPQALALPAGASRFVPLDPFRICDTRPGRPQKNFVRDNQFVINIPVTGIGGAPANVTAAVLTITAINRGGPAFVTAFPYLEPIPTASNINLTGLGHTASNLVTVKAGTTGRVGIYVEGYADLIVDLSGVYVPVTDSVRDGRMVVRASPTRVLDTRDVGLIGGGKYANVVLPLNMVPSHATAVSVNLTATRPVARGYFTAYPVSANPNPPDASNLNVSGPGDTRAIAAIVKVGDWGDGRRAFRVYSSHGGHVVVDLNGYVTGQAAAQHTEGLFVPISPVRRLDTRQPGQIGRMWPGWTVEFGLPSAWSANAQAAVMNLTTARTRGAGFLTAYAAGTARPNTSNLNPTAENQTIANHTISRASTRGIAVYHATGGHVIADLAGYFMGQRTPALQPPPLNPAPPIPPLPYLMSIPRLGLYNQWVYGGNNANLIVDNGHVWHWGGTGLLGQSSNMALFAHRTESTGMLRYQHHLRPGDELILKSLSDGRTWRYVFGYDYVTDDKPPNILAATRFWSGQTVSLVSCTKPNKQPTDLKYRLITTFTFDRWWE